MFKGNFVLEKWDAIESTKRPVLFFCRPQTATKVKTSKPSSEYVESVIPILQMR